MAVDLSELPDDTGRDFKAALHAAWRPVILLFYLGTVMNTVIVVGAAYLMVTCPG